MSNEEKVDKERAGQSMSSSTKGMCPQQSPPSLTYNQNKEEERKRQKRQTGRKEMEGKKETEKE